MSSRMTRSRRSGFSLNDATSEGSASTRETSPFPLSATSSPATRRKQSVANSDKSEPLPTRPRQTTWSSATRVKAHTSVTSGGEIEIKISSSESDSSQSEPQPRKRKRSSSSPHSVTTRSQRRLPSSPKLSPYDPIKIDTSSNKSTSSDGGGGDGLPSSKKPQKQRLLRGRVCRFRIGDDSDSENGEEVEDEKKKGTVITANNGEAIQLSSGDNGGKSKRRPRGARTRQSRLRSRRRGSTSSGTSTTTTTAVTQKKVKKPPKKEEKLEKEEASGTDSDDEKKGRKKIRKILKDKKLSSETKTAEALERERRKRLEDRQKLYNKNVLEESEEGAVTSSSRLILDHKKDSEEALIEVHPDLVKHLKPHQVQAVRFLYDNIMESVEEHKANQLRLSGAILAHCMGLGKSLSTIAFVHTLLTHQDVLGMRSCLVICPVNTLLNWHREWRQWMPEESELSIFELATAAANNFRMDVIRRWHNEGGILLMGYDMYRNLTTSLLKKTRRPAFKKLIPAALIDPGPDIVVCDEGHLLKNCKTGVTKAINSMKTPKRVILTGTPLQNNLAEYWTMVNFVKPNLLGSAREFANRFVNPIKNGQHSNSTGRDVQLMKKRAHVLFKTLDGCLQRRDYSCLTKYLPPRLEYVLKIRLSEVQCNFYRAFLQFRQERAASFATAAAAVAEDGRSTLFRDQQTLYRVWTHPHTLRMHETREAKRLLLLESSTEDESVDDDDEEDEADQDNDDVDDYIRDSDEADDDDDVNADVADAYSSSSSTTSGAIDDKNNNSAVPDTTVNKHTNHFSARTERATRRNQLVRNASAGSSTINLLSDSEESPSQVAAAGPRRSTPLENGDASNGVDSASQKPWWYRLYRDEYDLRIDVGAKLDTLFFLLKKSCEIGDKVLIFSQSLFSLDLIEWFLAAIDRQWCMSQGLEVDDNSKQSEEFQKLQQLETFEMPSLVDYFSDMERNTWRRGKDYERIDGSLNAVQRNSLQVRFNSPSQRFRLLIISTKAGGLGVNLTAANRLVIFDVSWNPSHDLQSIFRSYRFGQTKPVYIYRLVAQGTMEEKMYDRQVTKQSLALRVIDEQQIVRHFKEEDLRELYTFDPDPWDAELAKTRPPPSLPPKDRLLADLLSERPCLVASYHNHDSLLENRLDEGLSESERAEAWREYEEEKRVGRPMTEYQRLLLNNPEAAMLLIEQRRQADEEEQRRRMTAMTNAYAEAMGAAVGLYGRGSALGYTSVNPASTDSLDSMFTAIPAAAHQGGLQRPPPSTQQPHRVEQRDVFSESFNAMRNMLLSRYPLLARSPGTLHDMTMRLFVNSVANQVAAQTVAANTVASSASDPNVLPTPNHTGTTLANHDAGPSGNV